MGIFRVRITIEVGDSIKLHFLSPEAEDIAWADDFVQRVQSADPEAAAVLLKDELPQKLLGLVQSAEVENVPELPPDWRDQLLGSGLLQGVDGQAILAELFFRRNVKSARGGPA